MESGLLGKKENESGFIFFICIALLLSDSHQWVFNYKRDDAPTTISELNFQKEKDKNKWLKIPKISLL